MNILEFYKGKKILITGNTGFKGTWLSYILMNAGANVVGYSLKPNVEPSIYNILSMNDSMKTYYMDIRNYDDLYKCFIEEKPQIVFHLAAQPIVRESYSNPLYTYETNVMGTVNILECIRKSDCVSSFLNVTTDKVYKNNEWSWGYRETDILDGYDPYSNSKSCSELVTGSYKRSFFSSENIRISTARAGNVIGGGDFSNDRIIPDCIRAATTGKKIFVRNPDSVRPYQHVLEPLGAYIMIVAKQYYNNYFCGNYNVGPNDEDCVTTGTLANLFCEKWGKDVSWYTEVQEGPYESNFLKLDCSLIKNKLKWNTTWHISEAVEKTIQWHKAQLNGDNIRNVTEQQINEFFRGDLWQNTL